MSKLVTVPDYFSDPLIPADHPEHLWVHWHVFTKRGMTYPMPSGDATTKDGALTTAYVNHGRWVAHCPHCVNAAQIVSETDRRFYCAVCFNGFIGGKTIPVIFPKDELKDQIEDILTKRPEHVNHNWHRHESVTDLQAENYEHGIE